jgi:predicted secreted hydrolase
VRRRSLPILATCISLLPGTLLIGAYAGGPEDGRSTELATLLGSDAEAGFARVLEPREFRFPRDHGPHPEFRNEWWYVTGNLDAEGGRRFGFELTIFRFALAPDVPDSTSAWRSNQVYIAHLAVTDAIGQRFYSAQRFSRGAAGLAGAQSDPFRVWIDDWQMRAAGQAAGREHWRLVAGDAGFAIDLELRALKAPVLNGEAGLSQKSAEPGNASYYYSISRWQSDGTLRVGDRRFEVSGLSWLDREWSSSALGDEQQGWDWFALQLADGSELMFYSLRRSDGTQDTFSAGTWITADGESRHLAAADVALSVTDTWASPAGGEYPAGWRLSVPSEELELRVTPVMDDQELFTTVRYWEGAVDVAGSRAGVDVSGRGYVELTGYAEQRTDE